MALQGAAEHRRVNGPKFLPHAGSGKRDQYRGESSVKGMAPYLSSLSDGKEGILIRIIGALVNENEVETAGNGGRRTATGARKDPPGSSPRVRLVAVEGGRYRLA